MPDEAEVAGLLGLLLLTESRWPARFTADGKLILLRDQDRSSWVRSLIEEGHAIVRACLRRNQPGPYQIQAAISAVHSDADSFDATDWGQILALYDQLLAIMPTSVVAMNRAIALAEVRGPQSALDILDGLDLAGYHLFHAARADLLRRVGRHGESNEAATVKAGIDLGPDPSRDVRDRAGGRCPVSASCQRQLSIALATIRLVARSWGRSAIIAWQPSAPAPGHRPPRRSPGGSR